MVRALVRPSIVSCLAALGLLLTAGTAQATFTLQRVSGPTPFQAGCNGAPQTGVNYPNAEVEPYVAVDPHYDGHLVGVWQQDRWSDGGSNGLMTGVSWDGGRTWRRSAATFSRCAGGTAANGGDYERASDPWVSISPSGIVHQIGLSFNSSNGNQAVLASRSLDGGSSWSAPFTIAHDNSLDVALDKESITADPRHPFMAYAVWDRLTGVTSTNPQDSFGPAWFSRTTNGGASWEPARIIFDPGPDAQTIANQIVVLPNGDLVDMFTLILQAASSNNPPVSVATIRSTDRGRTWSQPVIVSSLQSIGTRDVKTGEPVRTGDIVPEIAVDRESGALYVVWQDDRFSGGLRDGIAISRSADGGRTWSPPVQVNRAPGVQAFTASVRVAEDGSVGVTYYDFRRDTADPAVLLTTYWLATSTDRGRTWPREQLVAEPFDMRTAPVAGGFFVGDYEGLVQRSDSLLPFFVQTNSGNLQNRTDVFAALCGEEDLEGIDRVEAPVSPQAIQPRIKAHREVLSGKR